jgi:hypothetical protein
VIARLIARLSAMPVSNLAMIVRLFRRRSERAREAPEAALEMDMSVQTRVQTQQTCPAAQPELQAHWKL